MPTSEDSHAPGHERIPWKEAVMGKWTRLLIVAVVVVVILWFLRNWYFGTRPI